MGGAARAEAEFKEAMRVNLSDVAAHHYYAILLKACNRMPEAEAQYLRALELSPRDPVVGVNYGILLDDAGRAAEAEAQYRRTIKINPNAAAARFRLGSLLTKTGRGSEGTAEIIEALTINPNVVPPETFADVEQQILGQAREHLEGGHLEKAGDIFQLAFELNDLSADAMVGLGDVSAQKSRRAEARGDGASARSLMREAESSYRAALEADPDCEAAEERLEGLRK